MHRIAAAALLATLLLAPATATAAQPQILDRAGDANGLNGQWYSPAMIGQIARAARDAIFQGDPFGEGHATPESYGPADLRAVTLETEYTATPVGDDGLRHDATALLIRVRTDEPIAAPDRMGTISITVLANLGAPWGDGCSSSFDVEVNEAGDLSGVTWFRWEDCRWNAGTTWGSFAHPSWTAARSADPQEVVLRIPFSSLSESELALLGVGAPMSEIQATTGVPPAATFDVTLRASEFVVGDDLPPDVPCTRGCPRR